MATPKWHKASATDDFARVSQSPVKLKADSQISATVEVNTSQKDLDPAVAAALKSGKFDRLEVDPSSTELPAERQTFRRRVKTEVEVPVTRKVKVPTMTEEEIEEEVMVKVRTTEHVSEPATKEVEEEYFELEDVVDYELKEVWIKKVVAQAVVKKVEVRKTRMATVETTVVREVEVEKEVPVRRKRIVQVPGFRVDEITDVRKVEVEGWQEVELVPQIREFGKVTIDRTAPVAGPAGRIVERKAGTVCDTMDPRLDQIDTDDETDEPQTIHSHGAVTIADTDARHIRKQVPPELSTSGRVRSQRELAQQSCSAGCRCPTCGSPVQSPR
eukprot:TRINITY_DN9048_c0_g1_i1.p1 TRINITY_DN9048_c0_g1~~TRINITY_DN9048_c0_g1_i1.p1  ORF type:complete len:343 (+),score=66.63 TRINITY_DN9048_c0_g1_i1:44-1030(+)